MSVIYSQVLQRKKELQINLYISNYCISKSYKLKKELMVTPLDF